MDGLQSLYTPRTAPEIIPHPSALRLLTPKVSTIDIPVFQEGLTVTEAEFLEDWYDVSDVIYEWCNGILEEKPVSDLEDWLMGQWFITIETVFFRLNESVGRVEGRETRQNGICIWNERFHL